MEEVTSIIKDSRLEKYGKLAKILKYLFVDLAKISQDSYYWNVLFRYIFTFFI